MKTNLNAVKYKEVVIYPTNKIKSSIMPQEVLGRRLDIYPIKIRDKSNSSNPSLVGIIVIVLLVLVSCGYYGYVYSEFQNSFESNWERVEKNGTSYYEIKLDITNGKIDYKFDSWLIDTTIASFEYTIIAPGKVKIDRGGNNQIYDIDISDNVMKITPALTSMDSYESWYK